MLSLLPRHLAPSVLLLAVVAAFCLIQGAGGLLVTAFPHYQTFDSWEECNYIGTCYELYCQNLRGGWVNPEFHNPSPLPFTEDVRGWWIINGPTTSNVDDQLNTWPCGQVQTGPCNDHTGGSAGRKYMYADASACFGYKFRVNSPEVLFTNSNASFSFWYFMNGRSLERSGVPPGYLVAQMSLDNGTTWDVLFNQTGRVQFNGSDPWEFVFVDLDTRFPAPATLAAPVRAIFQFEARAGGVRSSATYWKSDIAVDDIIFTQDGASSDLDPWIDPPDNGTDVSGGGGGDGITDGEIAGIVVGVVGGLGVLCCCLLLLLLLLLLLISPRGPGGRGGKGKGAEEAGGDAAGDGDGL